jgi:hypothetical protein
MERGPSANDTNMIQIGAGIILNKFDFVVPAQAVTQKIKTLDARLREHDGLFRGSLKKVESRT